MSWFSHLFIFNLWHFSFNMTITCFVWGEIWGSENVSNFPRVRGFSNGGVKVKSHMSRSGLILTRHCASHVESHTTFFSLSTFGEYQSFCMSKSDFTKNFLPWNEYTFLFQLNIYHGFSLITYHPGQQANPVNYSEVNYSETILKAKTCPFPPPLPPICF